MKRNFLVLAIILLLVVSGCSQEAVETDNPENTGSDQSVTPGQNDPEENDTSEDLRVIVLASVLNVRDQAGLSGEVVGSVSEEDSLVVTETKIDDSGFKWYKTIVDGSEGWIAGWYCINENEFNDKTGRAHLINAYDGHFDNSSVTVDGNKDTVISKMGQVRDQSGFMGGSFLEYDNYTFLLYGMEFEDKSEGDIVSILYHGTKTMYGVQSGATLDQVKEILGTPDREFVYTDQGEESLYANGTILLTYFTGSYEVNFIFNIDESLNRIQLSELIY